MIRARAGDAETAPLSRARQRARVLCGGTRLQWGLAALSPLAVLGEAIGPIAYGVAFTVGYGAPTPALLAGAAAAGLWAALMIEPAVIVTSERSWGTLQALAATPTPVAWPLIGRLAGSTLVALVVLPVVLAGLLAVFWRSVPDVLADLAQLPLPLLLGTAVVVLLGVFGMSLVLMGALLRSRYSAGMVNGLYGIVVLLGGFFAPLATLPGGFATIGRAIPVSWALEALREPGGAPVLQLVVGAALALLWCLGGVLLLGHAGRVLQRAPQGYVHG